MNKINHKRASVVVAQSAKDIACTVAAEIANLIQMRTAAGLPTVLGLATGNTPILLYTELIRLSHEKNLDFSRVVTFNLDEYYPMSPRSSHSYHHFMQTHLFNHINIQPANIHIPDGNLPRASVANFCAEYEQKIQQAGGINFLLLGIGENGHIGFNEPGSDMDTRTRLVTLDPITRSNAAADFGSELDVPHKAITMGVATILAAQKIVLIASGSQKAHIMHRVMNDPISSSIPATYLHCHSDTTIYLDPAAALRINQEQ